MTNLKTKQLLAYIAKESGHTTITSIMKLSYLIDLFSINKNKKQISNFQYKRYLYGPFDKGIYIYMNEFISDKIIKEKPSFTPGGDEYIIYEFVGHDREIKYDLLSKGELSLIDSVLTELQGLGARSLSEITYKTKPMKQLGATINNRKGINKTIDLNT